MPLTMSLARDEVLHIGTSTIKASQTQMHFIIAGNVPILLDRHYLKESQANTPMRELYRAIQTAFLDPTAPKADMAPLFDAARGEWASMQDKMDEVVSLHADGKLSLALKRMRDIFAAGPGKANPFQPGNRIK